MTSPGTERVMQSFSVLRSRSSSTSLQPIYKEERAGDVKDSQADISKARDLLGYTPIVGLEEGLRHTLAWCRTESSVLARGH